MNRKAVFIDIDGTLFATGIGIPQTAKQAIRKLRENGHLAFINTGRSRANIFDKYEEIGFDGYVAGCGAYVEINEKIIKNILFDKKELNHLTEVFDEATSNIIYEGPVNIYYQLKDKEKMLMLFKRFPDVWPTERFALYNPKDALVNKLCCQLYTNSDVELLKRELGDQYELIIHAGNEYAEAMPKGLSKSLGMSEVLEYYGLDKKDSIAIGDSINDMDMLEFSNFGIAMGNACDELKEIADFTTKSVADDGIEYALKTCGLI